jgi:hypothetical protein
MIMAKPMFSVVFAGQPLAGKATTMVAIRNATGAPLEVVRTAVPSGHWKGAPFNLLQMRFDCGDDVVRLSTVSGGVPIEGNGLVLPEADLAVFVIDGREHVRDRDIEWWQKLSGTTRGRWVFVLNRRPDVKVSASEILQAIGIDPSNHCFEYSAAGDDGSRIRDFLCHEIGLTKR